MPNLILLESSVINRRHVGDLLQPQPQLLFSADRRCVMSAYTCEVDNNLCNEWMHFLHLSMVVQKAVDKRSCISWFDMSSWHWLYFVATVFYRECLFSETCLMTRVAGKRPTPPGHSLQQLTLARFLPLQDALVVCVAYITRGQRAISMHSFRVS